MSERRPDRIPEWAQRERTRDLLWLQENLHIFFPAACLGFEEAGRGAIVTDTTTLVTHAEGVSHPFFYMTLEGIEEQNWNDTSRMVKAYDPTWELVTVLLKQGRESAYRIGVPGAKKGK